MTAANAIGGTKADWSMDADMGQVFAAPAAQYNGAAAAAAYVAPQAQYNGAAAEAEEFTGRKGVAVTAKTESVKKQTALWAGSSAKERIQLREEELADERLDSRNALKAKILQGQADAPMVAARAPGVFRDGLQVALDNQIQQVLKAAPADQNAAMAALVALDGQANAPATIANILGDLLG